MRLECLYGNSPFIPAATLVSLLDRATEVWLRLGVVDFDGRLPMGSPQYVKLDRAAIVAQVRDNPGLAGKLLLADTDEMSGTITLDYMS